MKRTDTVRPTAMTSSAQNGFSERPHTDDLDVDSTVSSTKEGGFSDESENHNPTTETNEQVTESGFDRVRRIPPAKIQKDISSSHFNKAPKLGMKQKCNLVYHIAVSTISTNIADTRLKRDGDDCSTTSDLMVDESYASIQAHPCVST